MGNFVALERAGLIFNVPEFDEAIDRARDLLRTDGIGAEWERKRTEYLSNTVNLTDLLLDVVATAAEPDFDLARVDGLSRPD